MTSAHWYWAISLGTSSSWTHSAVAWQLRHPLQKLMR